MTRLFFPAQFLVLFFMFLSYSAANEPLLERELSPFNYLYVYGDISVDLVPAELGEETRIAVRSVASGVKLADIDTEVKDGQLYVRVSSNFVRDITIRMTIFYSEPVFALRAANGARIFTSEPLVVDYLKLHAFNGGNMEIEVETSALEVDVLAGSLILIKGKTEQQEVTARGGGTYDAFGMHAEVTALSVVTGGVARVFTTKTISGRVTSNGFTLVNGNPENRSVRTRFGGSIDYE